MEANRIFYSILERVGGSGSYQTRSLVIWSFVMLTVGSSTFFNAFLFYQSNYKCPSIEIDCKTYVCSLPEEQRYKFIVSQANTLISKFGDYRCEGDSEINKLQSFIYIGGIIGAYAGALLSEIITKRKIIIATIVGNLIGITVALTAHTLLIASFGLFINYAAKCIQLEVIICIITQTVAQSLRGKHTIITYIFYSLGVTLNGFFFKIMDWKQVLIFYLALPLIVGLLGLSLYIQQTPFDLVINYPPQYSYKRLKIISIQNGYQYTDNLSIEEIADIRKEYDENEAKRHNYTISIMDLFRYESLRTISIVSIILHFLTSFQFIAPELALKDYSLGIYLNGILIGFSELAACIFCYFIVDLCQRKKIVYITQVISLVISTIIFAFYSCKQQNQCNQNEKIIQSIGLFFFRFSVTIAYNFFYMIQYEIFPNQIRALGLQCTAIASLIAVVLVPPIMNTFEHLGISIVITYAGSCILIMFFLMFIPETFGIPPPQMIQELKYEHHKAENTVHG